MKRVTPKTLQERQNNKGKYADLPKLRDILVDLSVKNTPKVVRKLRLIGPPNEITEIQDKKAYYVEGPDGKKIRKTEKVPFPDAHKNSSPTRIGHDDAKQCPWRQMGYVGTTRFVQRCLEEQEDGTWAHKILVKGPAIFDALFNWEQSRREEGDPDISTFLGGDSAPVIRIAAVQDSSKLGGVDYTVGINSKDMPLTEEHINLLRSVREPSADDLNSYRKDWNDARQFDTDMPEWRDYFEFGHDVRRIFKFTPPAEDAPTPVLEEKEDETEEENATTTEAVATESSDDSFEVEDLNW